MVAARVSTALSALHGIPLSPFIFDRKQKSWTSLPNRRWGVAGSLHNRQETCVLSSHSGRKAVNFLLGFGATVNVR